MRMKERMMICLMLQMALTCWTIVGQRAVHVREAAAFAENESIFVVEAAITPLPSVEEPPPSDTPAPPTATLPPDDADTMLRVEVIRETAVPPSWTGKRVLIYHTHTWEAYEQVPEAPYKETEKWRTRDNEHNVVAVGEALTASLTALGLTVVHDTTAFEPPNLDDAYERSLDMLEERASAGEQYDLYIDLHRDALSSASTIRRSVVIGGEESARFMVLIGKGTTGGYAEKPDWESNQIIAERITSSLNGQCEGLARDVKIKTGRFNQHVADCCVLIECGVNTNTLEQVLCGVPYLAQAIADALAE